MNQETLSEKAKAIQDTFNPKKKLSEHLTATQAWDAVAFRLMKGELAPKGFVEIKSGGWKGKVKANIEFLPKESVQRAIGLTQTMIRTFRKSAQDTLQRQIDSALVNQKALKWYQFREKWAYKGIIEALSGTQKELDNIEVPR